MAPASLAQQTILRANHPAKRDELPWLVRVSYMPTCGGKHGAKAAKAGRPPGYGVRSECTGSEVNSINVH